MNTGRHEGHLHGRGHSSTAAEKTSRAQTCNILQHTLKLRALVPIGQFKTMITPLIIVFLYIFFCVYSVILLISSKIKAFPQLLTFFFRCKLSLNEYQIAINCIVYS